MHIALLTDGIYPYIMGGMQKHSYYLAKYLVRAGVKVDVYHAIPEGQPFPEQPEGFSTEELKNLQFFPIHFPKPGKIPGHYIRNSYLYSKRVYEKFLKQEPVDFVYIQGFSGWYFLGKRLKVEKFNIPTGINFHGVEMFQKAPSLRVNLEHLMLRPWIKWNLRHSDIIFSLGGKLTDIQKKPVTPLNKVIEIPIGITNEWLINNIPSHTGNIRKFVFIGRYERRKGIEELHSVIKQLIKENYNFQFHFIGPVPQSKRLNSNNLLAFSPNNLLVFSPNNLMYHGSIQDEKKIQKILQQSDVLVCPSWSEGMPTVILEAMASGCAIIASDVGAVSEQVSPENGILIEPGNKYQLKQALEKMIQLDNGNLMKMKRNSIQKIKDKFLWENVAEQTIEAIRSVGQ